MISFLNEFELICLPTCIAIVSTLLNGFNYGNLTFYSVLIICLQTVQVLLFNTNSIQHYLFILTHSNGSKYDYVIAIFQFRHTVKEFQVLLFNANNSTQY